MAAPLESLFTPQNAPQMYQPWADQVRQEAAARTQAAVANQPPPAAAPSGGGGGPSSRYAFIRAENPDFTKLQQAGYTALFDFRDPRLQQQINRAQAAGVQFGLWGDPGTMSPEDFAKAMAGMRQQYGASVIVPDIENVGKGYQGSAGWDYNTRLAAALKQYVNPQQLAMTVMGNQRDFNYEAYKDMVSAWLPQAYGADPSKSIYDPQYIKQVLIDRGVDPALVEPVMGVGHGNYWQSYQGPAAMWTYDDFMLNQALPYTQGY